MTCNRSYAYLNLELTEEWSLRHRATEAVKEILPGIERHFAGIADGTVGCDPPSLWDI
jgi:ribosomal protein L31E